MSELDVFDQINQLLEAKDEYIKLLLDELNEIVPIASAHGWKSTRYEEGNLLREKIKKLSGE